MNFVSLTKNLRKTCAAYFPWPERFLLCLAVIIAYASVWPNEFIFDDLYLITGNEFLKHWSSLPKLLTSLNFAGGGLPEGFYRPIQMLAYFFIYQTFGPSTVAFHALNITLQALNACLLHRFGVRAGFKKAAAFAAALLWAVHPLHTSAVTYMSGTAELLWGTFCLLGLMTLLPDFAPRKIWQAMIFFMLALGSKEAAVVFPALAAITFFFVSKDRTNAPAYLRTWPLWLLAACYIGVWLWFRHNFGSSIDISGLPIYTSHLINRILTCLATLPVYVRLILWPADLHMERTFPVFTTLSWLPALGALLAGLGLLQILWGRMRRGLALSCGLLWFAVALSPVTGIVVPVDWLMTEGWMYMPTMGLFLGMAQSVAGFFEKRKNATRLLVLALAISLGATTFFQNKVWRNIGTLYQNIVQHGDPGYPLCNDVGLFYMKQGEFDKAIGLFQCALDHPQKRHQAQWTAQVHLRLALAWLQVSLDEREGVSLYDVTRALSSLPSSPHIAKAIRELCQAIQADPDCTFAHMALSAIYRYQGDNQMADFHDRQLRDILQKQGIFGR